MRLRGFRQEATHVDEVVDDAGPHAQLHRHTGPNLLIPKHSVKYIYKESEGEEEADDNGMQDLEA